MTDETFLVTNPLHLQMAIRLASGKTYAAQADLKQDPKTPASLLLNEGLAAATAALPKGGVIYAYRLNDGPIITLEENRTSGTEPPLEPSKAKRRRKGVTPKGAVEGPANTGE